MSETAHLPTFERPELYINRELSWLDFNARVLEEAQDKRNPLLERVKFMAIVASNLDEFYEILGSRSAATARVRCQPQSPRRPDARRTVRAHRRTSPRSRSPNSIAAGTRTSSRP